MNEKMGPGTKGDAAIDAALAQRGERPTAGSKREGPRVSTVTTRKDVFDAAFGKEHQQQAANIARSEKPGGSGPQKTFDFMERTNKDQAKKAQKPDMEAIERAEGQKFIEQQERVRQARERAKAEKERKEAEEAAAAAVKEKAPSIAVSSAMTR